MRQLGMLIVMVLVCAGCNLSRTEVASVPTDTPDITDDASLRPTRTPISFGDEVRPTLLPLPDTGSVINTPQPTLIPVTSVPVTGGLCQIYTTFSGNDPRNNLSLRNNASTNAPQIYRVLTDKQVLLVAGSQEIEADGYHWLNVIYEASAQMRYQGWMARDSYMVNGVRDTSIATLRPTGAQAGC